jgi:hypothetical protein
MTRKHWIILGAIAALISIGTMVLLAFVAGFMAGRAKAKNDLSPIIYTTDQSTSSHAGYRRTTLTSGDIVFVNDYEEACLQLANPEPTHVIGYVGWIGNAHVCEIPGQSSNAYIAGDCGSEMPAYEPFRNPKQPPFDWRTATFREMSVCGPNQSSSDRVTNDPALIAEVIHTLRDGKPVELPAITFAQAQTKLYTLKFASDQLPGLLFCPPVCTDTNGQFYVAESLLFDYTAPNPLQLHAHWIPVSPTLTKWLKTP